MEITSAPSTLSTPAVNLSINESTPGDFAHWEAATAIILISRLIFSVPVSLFINLTIIVTITKTKSLRKPLDLIHISMLTVNCLITVPDVITSVTYVPNAIRSCECPRLTSLAYFVTEQLYIAFQPLNITSLALFMFLSIKGKKRLVSYKTVGASIVVCIGITLLLVTVSSTSYHLSQQTYICSGPCPGNMAQSSTGLTTFGLYIIFCYLPSLLIVTVCTLWSCAIFKKNYIGGRNNELTRRIISLPIVLPLIIITPTLASALILAGIRQFLVSFEPRDLPYWILFTRFMISHLHVVAPRVVYPIILLKLNPPIAYHWKEVNKKMLKCGKRNQIEPILVSSAQTVPNTNTILTTVQ